MTRTQMRQLTFELLYSMEIQKITQTEKSEQIGLFISEQEIKEEEQEKLKEYMQKVIEGIESNEQQIIMSISENLKEGWNINRISKIDLTLLKLAIYEMVYANVPYKVEVNEVVELAKKYGEENSSSFINGILANIIKKAGLA